jgi:hypothetical protein
MLMRADGIELVSGALRLSDYENGVEKKRVTVTLDHSTVRAIVHELGHWLRNQELESASTRKSFEVPR